MKAIDQSVCKIQWNIVFLKIPADRDSSSAGAFLNSVNSYPAVTVFQDWTYFECPDRRCQLHYHRKQRWNMSISAEEQTRGWAKTFLKTKAFRCFADRWTLDFKSMQGQQRHLRRLLSFRVSSIELFRLVMGWKSPKPKCQDFLQTMCQDLNAGRRAVACIQLLHLTDCKLKR